MEGETSSLIFPLASEQKLSRNTTSSISVQSSFNQKQKKFDIASKQPIKVKASLAFFESPSKSIYSTPTYSANIKSYPLVSTGVEEIEEKNNHSSFLSPSPSQSSIYDEKPLILFVAEFIKLNIKLSLGNSSAEQVN